MKAPPTFLMQEATLLHQQGTAFRGGGPLRAVSWRRDRKNVDAHFLLANIHCQQGAPDDGIETARKAIKLEPKYAAAHNLIAIAQQRLGRTSLRSTASIARSRQPEVCRGLVQSRAHLLSLGARPQAIESFDRRIALNPDHAQARHGRGTALMLEDRNAAALAISTRRRARSASARTLSPIAATCSTGSAASMKRSPILRARSELARTTTTCATTPRWWNCCTGAGARGWAHYDARLTARSLDTDAHIHSRRPIRAGRASR
jgi:tetratricopeptide (TPR) repeat protein